MTEIEVSDLLDDLGFRGIYSRKDLAKFLNLPVKIIDNQVNAKKLRPLCRGCYDIRDIKKWLYENPRYLSSLRGIPNLPWCKDESGMQTKSKIKEGASNESETGGVHLGGLEGGRNL